MLIVDTPEENCRNAIDLLHDERQFASISRISVLCRKAFHRLSSRLHLLHLGDDNSNTGLACQKGMVLIRCEPVAEILHSAVWALLVDLPHNRTSGVACRGEFVSMRKTAC